MLCADHVEGGRQHSRDTRHVADVVAQAVQVILDLNVSRPELLRAASYGSPGQSVNRIANAALDPFADSGDGSEGKDRVVDLAAVAGSLRHLDSPSSASGGRRNNDRRSRLSSPIASTATSRRGSRRSSRNSQRTTGSGGARAGPGRGSLARSSKTSGNRNGKRVSASEGTAFLASTSRRRA